MMFQGTLPQILTSTLCVFHLGLTNQHTLTVVPPCFCTTICVQDPAAGGRSFYPPAAGGATPGGEGEGFS